MSVQRPPAGDLTLVAATGTVAGGMFLTTLPLTSIFTDWSWFTVSVGCALPYLVIVAALRYRGPARWWHSVLGLLASVLMLLWVFVPQHLGFGVLPTPASGHDISELVRQARQSMQAEHAPLASTQALRLLVAAALAGLACLTDVLGVLLRRPLLAAAPLLEVLAVASATSSKAANPFWFATAAVGFLLILLAGTRLQDRAWGPSVDGSAGRLGGGRRMAITGIIAALIVPILLPGVPTNLLARAAHHDGGGDGSGNGKGGIRLSSLASLRGSLQRPTPSLLFTVQVTAGQAPQYIRTYIDDEFDNKDGWKPSGSDFGDPDQTSLNDSPLPLVPSTPGTSDVSNFQANFTINNLEGDALPILANPVTVGIAGSGTWNRRTSSIFDASLRRGLTYTESVSQPNPTDAQLHEGPNWTSSGNPELDKQYTSLPKQKAVVVDLANRLTAGLPTDYDKARAISSYFKDQGNGFVYSLSTGPSDSGDALVDFLNDKIGFCQQYAAAAAVLMRLAGLPARVVIGFTHQAPDADGKFVVTTSDAHAWVEVFINSVGWISFDPTPLVGSEAARAGTFQWDPQPREVLASSAEPSAARPQSAGAESVTASATDNQASGSGPIVPTVVWQVGIVVVVVLVVLLAIFSGPRWLRRRQRRRRLDRARQTGNPEPLWLELAATAADRDALWPSTVTVGQVAQWLSRHGVDERGRAAVSVVASTVERDRYSAELVTTVPPESITALDQALTRWARRTDRRLSLINRWLPKSLLGRQPRWHR